MNYYIYIYSIIVYKMKNFILFLSIKLIFINFSCVSIYQTSKFAPQKKGIIGLYAHKTHLNQETTPEVIDVILIPVLPRLQPVQPTSIALRLHQTTDTFFSLFYIVFLFFLSHLIPSCFLSTLLYFLSCFFYVFSFPLYFL